MAGDVSFALGLVVVVSMIYLLVLRLIDVNEREPLWGLITAVTLGAIAGAVATVVVEPSFRLESTFGAALTSEGAKLAALVGVISIFEGVSRLRGWSEFNGVADGIVYGAAVGLGFAVGVAFVREATFPTSVALLGEGSGTFTILWTTLLSGLQEALFGALTGAGMAVALTGPGPIRRALAALGGIGLAIVAHAGYIAFDRGNSLGPGAGPRHWIALLLPLALVAALLIRGLLTERKAILGELDGELTSSELRVLRSPALRRAATTSRLVRLDLAGWLVLRTRQNRAVQLALVKRRLRRSSGAGRSELAREAEALRQALRALPRVSS